MFRKKCPVEEREERLQSYKLQSYSSGFFSFTTDHHYDMSYPRQLHAFFSYSRKSEFACHV